MNQTKTKILDFIDAFNEEVSMFKEIEYEFFQEQEKISKALAKNQVESPMALGNKTQEAYNVMLGAGFDLLLHGLSYKEYQKMMRNKLLKVDEQFLTQLQNLSKITKEKTEKYNLIKQNVKQALNPRIE